MTGRTAGPRDAGATLVEVVVAVALLSVLMTFVTALAVMVTRTTSGDAIRLDNSVQSELGVAAVSKVLRTAVLPAQLDDQVCTNCANTAIVTASGTSVSFYANLNNTGQGPSLVTFDVVQDPSRPTAAVLRQTTQPPLPAGNGQYTFCDPAQPSCQRTTRVIARGLPWPVPVVFSYYDYDGNAIAGTSIAGSDLPRINSVDVVVTTQTVDGARRPPARTTVARVRLPNDEINVLVNPGATS